MRLRRRLLLEIKPVTGFGMIVHGEALARRRVERNFFRLDEAGRYTRAMPLLQSPVLPSGYQQDAEEEQRLKAAVQQDESLHLPFFNDNRRPVRDDLTHVLPDFPRVEAHHDNRIRPHRLCIFNHPVKRLLAGIL